MSDTNVISDPEVQRAREVLANARRPFAFIGAGLSAASGIPTFRGPKGAYSDPAIVDWVHVETFETGDRAGMLRWYEERKDDLKKVWPNPGHYALARLGIQNSMSVATQNVDGLVEQAALEEGAMVEVLHLHGTLSEARCHNCRAVYPASRVDYNDSPKCRMCDGPLRPNVVWFGEELPHHAWEDAMIAAVHCDVCLLVGTSGLVYPAAQIPESAKERGATVIEVNPAETALSELADIRLVGKAETILPFLVADEG